MSVYVVFLFARFHWCIINSAYVLIIAKDLYNNTNNFYLLLFKFRVFYSSKKPLLSGICVKHIPVLIEWVECIGHCNVCVFVENLDYCQCKGIDIKNFFKLKYRIISFI